MRWPHQNLAADAPVADVLHPVQVGPLEALRHERDPPVPHGLDRRLGQRPDVDPPLLRDDRLHHRARALRVPDRVTVRLDLLDQPARLEVGDHPVACLEAIEARVLAGVLVERAVGREDVDHLEPVPLPDLEVDRVVPGRHLQRARARLHVDRLVRDHRHRPVGRRHDDRAPDQVLPALVVGVHGDGGVGRDRLRPRRRDRDLLVGLVPRPVEGGIAHVPERALHLAVLDLEVGQRGLTLGIPVDDPLAAKDQPLLVELYERPPHCAPALRVEGERLAIPVRRGPEPAVLLRDSRPRGVDELPDPFEERLAPDLVATEPLLVELPLDERVDRDRGVIHARQPERRVAAHAVPADQRVLDGRGEAVPHVQLAGQVRRRHDDRERRPVALWLEVARLLPVAVDPLLDRRGLVGAAHLLACARLGRHRALLDGSGQDGARANETPPKRGTGGSARPSPEGRPSRRRLRLRSCSRLDGRRGPEEGSIWLVVCKHASAVSACVVFGVAVYDAPVRRHGYLMHRADVTPIRGMKNHDSGLSPTVTGPPSRCHIDDNMYEAGNHLAGHAIRLPLAIQSGDGDVLDG